ncbi:MAG: hypothetical protein KF784_00915 [Fimbriimonadaceae bacterium]|nr:hypothetical protein [Fimbriimonadaceae bacterium]
MLKRSVFLNLGIAFSVVAGCLVVSSIAQSSAQQTKPPATAPTKGTVQMPGDNGKVGTIYQLGPKGTEMHFTLDSAAVATRYKTVDTNIIAGKDERLLVLTYTVHNPLKTEQMADSQSFKFTVVSPDDKNVEFRGAVYEPVKRTAISQMLKPAQKVKLTAVIPIFAQGPITKIIVARGQGPVLRYDLRESLVKSTSVFATDGVTIGNDATVELGKPFDFGGFDMEIQDISESAATIGGYVASDSKGVYRVVVKFSNPLSKPLSVGWQYFTPKLTDENGEEIHWAKDLASMSGASYFSSDVDMDSSVRAQYLFAGAKGLKLAKFKLTQNSTGRAVTVKLQ